MSLSKNIKIILFSYLSFYEIITKASVLSKQDRKACRKVQYNTSDKNITNINFGKSLRLYSQVQYIFEISKQIKIKVSYKNNVSLYSKKFNLFYSLDELKQYGKVSHIKFNHCRFTNEDKFDYDQKMIRRFSQKEQNCEIQYTIDNYHQQFQQYLLNGSSFRGIIELYESEINDMEYLDIFRNAQEIRFDNTITNCLYWKQDLFNNLKRVRFNETSIENNFKSLTVSQSVNWNFQGIDIITKNLEQMRSDIKIINKVACKSIDIAFLMQEQILPFREILQLLQDIKSEAKIIFKLESLIYTYNPNKNKKEFDEYTNFIRILSLESLINQYNKKQDLVSFQLIKSNLKDYKKCIKCTNETTNSTHYLYFNQLMLDSFSITVE